MLPGGWEWVLIILVILLLFGGRKLPELARSVGQSIIEFKKGMKDPEELPKGADDSAKKPDEKPQ